MAELARLMGGAVRRLQQLGLEGYYGAGPQQLRELEWLADKAYNCALAAAAADRQQESMMLLIACAELIKLQPSPKVGLKALRGFAVADSLCGADKAAAQPKGGIKSLKGFCCC